LRFSALARLTGGKADVCYAAGPGLQAIPFEPPHGGRLVENYVVEYELVSAGGARYKSHFAVYVYDDRGKGLYLVKEPYVKPDVAGTVAEAIDSLSTWLAPSPVISVDPLGYLFAELRRAGYLGGRSPEQQEEAKAVTHYLMREILGYSLVDPLLRDPELEDVSCEGPGRPVKVWHKRYNSHGWLESNVLFRDQEDLNSVVARLVQRSNRSLSVSSPVVDCVLPEGYRLAATWGKEVTSLGSSFSIRKLRATPYTVSELIRAGTLDSGLAAYLWLLLEMKGFVIIAGVTASGKTTLLNAVATVLNPNWKVLSIEDTREITLPQGGWKPLHTRYSHGAGGDVTLFELVKLSLRERPDFVVLGESRGEEVQALFQAAATGTGCLTTFHASNPDGLVTRLTQPPLSVAQSSLGLIDAVVFMVRGQGGHRFVQSVFEPVGEGAGRAWTNVFAREGEEVQREGSASLGRRGQGFGHSAKKISAELERRTAFLDALVGRGVSDYETLAKELRAFYATSALTF
jgi:archaeal flagellar protein FlaI